MISRVNFTREEDHDQLQNSRIQLFHPDLCSKRVVSFMLADVGKMKFGGCITIVMVHVRRYCVSTLRRVTKNSLFRIFRGSHQPVIKTMGSQIFAVRAKSTPLQTFPSYDE